jgi:16S rRNA (guanine1207-N2)-methyltransferase
MHAVSALNHVLEAQPDLLPAGGGRVLFLRAQPMPLLTQLEGRLVCEQTWKPHAQALEAVGQKVCHEVKEGFQTVLLLPERQRDTIYGDLARAYDLLEPGGTLVVALHNDWGAKRTEQLLAEVARQSVNSISKNHCRVFWVTKTENWQAETLDTWRSGAAMRRILEGQFWSMPGLFNWDKIDTGSRLLTEHLPVNLSGAVADLGSSWGYLSDHLLRHCPNLRSLDLYEADGRALECARRNLGLVPCPVRPRIHWRDVTQGLNAPGKYDHVIMNPPFHDGRDADPLLGMKFITAASTSLRSTGDLWLVANKHLPYEALLQNCFEFSEKTVEAEGFKVLHAAQPKAELMRRSHQSHQRESRRKSSARSR